MIDKIFEIPKDKEEIKQLFKENKIKKYDTLKIRCIVCNIPFDWTIIRYDRPPKVCSKNCQCKLMINKQYNEIYNTPEKKKERAKKSILKSESIKKRVETQLKNGHLANNGNITMTKKWKNTTKEERLNILKNEMLSKESIKKSREAEWNNPKFKNKMLKLLEKYRIPGKGFQIKFCNTCKEETRHLNSRCCKCNLILFDRNQFYKDKFNIIKFDFLDKKVSIKDIDTLQNVPGVWAKFTESGECLDVSQTKDIGKEMLWSIRMLDFNKNKSDKELKQDYKFSIRKKYRNMYNDSNGKIIFKLVATNIYLKEKREFIEIQYAHDYKAKYWNLAPGQKLIKEEKL